MTPGTHLCSFWRDAEELAQVSRAFVAAGLAAGDRVMYVAADRPSGVVLDSLRAAAIPVESACASGQLAVHDFARVYGAGALDLAEVARGFRTAAAQARADGFPALRVAAEMGDVRERFGSARRAAEWEQTATGLQREEGLSSVCQYDAGRLSDADAARIGAEHDGAAPSSVSRFPVTFSAVGPERSLRISGELDLNSHRELGRVLAARLAASQQLRLHVAELSFADLSAARELFLAARSLPADGLITLVGAQPALRRVIDLAGLRHPQLVIC